VSDDADKDGIPALAEFALGMSNEDPNTGNGQAGLPVASIAPDGRLQLTFLVPANAGAVQGHGFADVIYRVQAADMPGIWTTIATKTFSANWSGPGTAIVGAESGGFVPVTTADSVAAGSAQRFLRLQVTWVP
jgi:hypothetical protein